MNPVEVYEVYQSEPSDLADHLPFLKACARGTVMEIGVREGVSTAALLSGVCENGGHLFSIDIDDYSRLYQDGHWTFIQGNTITEAERILERTGKMSNRHWIDFLFIDGDHTYSGCLSDLTNFGKYAKVIAVHDTASEWLGVWQATIEYFRSPWAGPFATATFFTGSNGLGVLYR